MISECLQKDSAKLTSSGSQSGLPVIISVYRIISDHKSRGTLTHIQRLNSTIPHHIGAYARHSTHNNMVIDSDAPRPESTTSLRVWIGGVIFERDTLQSLQRGARDVTTMAVPVWGDNRGDWTG